MIGLLTYYQGYSSNNLAVIRTQNIAVKSLGAFLREEVSFINRIAICPKHRSEALNRLFLLF